MKTKYAVYEWNKLNEYERQDALKEFDNRKDAMDWADLNDRSYTPLTVRRITPFTKKELDRLF